MSKVRDLVGESFGRLIVVEHAGVKSGHVMYKCECSCGETMYTRGSTLRANGVKSCGCIKADVLKAHRKTKGFTEYPKKMDEREKASYRSRLHRLKKEYNLTEQEYQDISDDQKGVCPICKRSLDWSSKVPHVDHNHDTGRVRQLLCQQCNVGLGSFGDSVNSLENAKQYLIKHKE